MAQQQDLAFLGKRDCVSDPRDDVVTAKDLDQCFDRRGVTPYGRVHIYSLAGDAARDDRDAAYDHGGRPTLGECLGEGREHRALARSRHGPIRARSRRQRS